MKDLVSLLKAPQDTDGILNGRLIHHNRLETPLKGRILLNVLPVLVQRRGSDAVELAPCQHRLKHVARIHCAVSLTCAHDQMQLIYEKNDLTIRLFYILKDGLEPLLKLAPILGSGHQSAHIKGKDLFVLKRTRNIATGYSLSKCFYNRSLTNTGLTDEHRVVLSLPRQNPDDITDLSISANYRIKLLTSGLLNQLCSVFVQSIVSSLRIIRCHISVATNLGQHLKESVPVNSELRQKLFYRLIRLLDDRHEQMLNGNI